MGYGRGISPEDVHAPSNHGARLCERRESLSRDVDARENVLGSVGRAARTTPAEACVAPSHHGAILLQGHKGVLARCDRLHPAQQPRCRGANVAPVGWMAPSAHGAALLYDSKSACAAVELQHPAAHLWGRSPPVGRLAPGDNGEGLGEDHSEVEDISLDAGGPKRVAVRELARTAQQPDSRAGSCCAQPILDLVRAKCAGELLGPKQHLTCKAAHCHCHRLCGAGWLRLRRLVGLRLADQA
mmetsp:Transcript_53979/g.144611  ORF Transcript_53979/g.144611 Transcript_53979/m.144611 type:complete len:242 (+) Transcript_53979:894-1619(+)